MLRDRSCSRLLAVQMNTVLIGCIQYQGMHIPNFMLKVAQAQSVKFHSLIVMGNKSRAIFVGRQKL